MIAFLLKNWQLVAIAVLAGLLSLSAAANVKLYNRVIQITAEFNSFKTQTKALGDAAIKKANREKADDEALHTLTGKQFAATTDKMAKDALGLAATNDRLRRELSDSRSRRVQPVSIGTGLSCDEASRQRISGAVQDFIRSARDAFTECRSAVVDFRTDVARLALAADDNTAALSCGVDWFNSEREIHR